MKSNNIGGSQYIPKNYGIDKPKQNQVVKKEISVTTKCEIPKFKEQDKLEQFLQKIKDISEAMNSLKVHDKEAVLICGDTGAGKSTLLNYLAGVKGICRQQKNSKDFIIEFENPIAVVSEKLIAETTTPKRYEIADKLAIWDCPGFNDNRGEIVDIANAFSITNIAHKVDRVKVLAVVEESSLNSRKGQFLRSMINKIQMMLPDEKDLPSSVVFCFTKTHDIINYQKELLRIANDKNDLTPENRSFLTRIAERENFVVFPRPTKEGLVSKEHQELILYKLHKSTAAKSEILPVLSPNSIKYMREVMGYVNDKAIELFDTIAKNMADILVKSDDSLLGEFSKDFVGKIFPLNESDTDVDIINKLETVIAKYKLGFKEDKNIFNTLRFLSEKILNGITAKFFPDGDSFEFDTLDMPFQNLLYDIRISAEKRGMSALVKEIDYVVSKDKHQVNIKV